MTKYLLKIDTDSYAGNFERPLIAFVTGIVDNGGDKEAILAHKELTVEQAKWFEDHVISDYYDEEYPEMALTLETDGTGGQCHSAGVYFTDWLGDELYDVVKKRAYDFEVYAANKNDIMWNHINPKILDVSVSKTEIITKKTQLF